MEKRNVLADLLALLVVCAIGLPLVFFIAAAFAEGEVRRREIPLRALLGSTEYETLRDGHETSQHYMGDDRLAPDFSLPMSNGETWRLSEHRGKVIVMNFWTVTCQPCIEEMPSLTSLARIVEERDDIELVTISVDEDWDTVRTAVPDSSPLTVLLDADKAVVRDKFGTRLYPETWVIDPEGVIRLRVDGRRNWADPVVIDVLESYL